MGYNKFIRSGENFELYEYENEPVVREHAPRGVKNNASDMDLGTDRANTLSERQLGKRQDNARHASMAFRRLVSSNLSRAQPPLLLTLTYAENITDLHVGYEDYRSFVQALRYKYGKTFKYICVPEFQKRGAVHFHALFWGLPAEVFSQERKTRTLALIWGKGFLFIKETDGDGKLSSYLAKYMSKAFTDRRLKNQKAYISSRNVTRPTIGKGFSPVYPVLENYVGDNNPPIHDKSYHTKYLGMCRYRLFKLPLDS